ncbi:MAG TPA: rhomboid family intramembrane serine protease [Dehalococcoidia bacterium]|nr:rhomboid family intramembrane serine protease [Dehalococcoidia bacterium]
MIPVGDNVRSRTFPYVNLAIIIANFLVFFYELSLGNEVDSFLRDWGVVPGLVTDYFDHPGDHPYRVLFTPITSMFIHGGWFHILGNMIFLWVFGDNVEDAIGHVSYLFFYVLAGIAAATAQIWVDTGSAVPMVGASGAIAGVLGGYVVLYPRATIAAVIFPFFFWAFPVPAFVLIGLWFFLQLLNGAASIGTAVGASEGVAWWAHIGGFLAGLVLVWAFRDGGRTRSVNRARW